MQDSEDLLEKRKGISTRMLLIVVIVLVLVALGAGITGFVFYQRTHASCTIGISGSTITVTLEGNDANDFCNDPIFAHSAAYFRYEGTPTGAEICVGDIKRSDGSTLHYFVRDNGTSTLLDMALCQRIRQ